MEENILNKNEVFKNSAFSKNIKDLFNTEFNQYYNKNRLNNKLKSIISKEKTLNARKIKDFNYSKMFHRFKIDMVKFEEEQNKQKNFYKTLYEENLKFNKDYKNSYSSKIQSNNLNIAEKNVKSKTFQKFYNKHKINLEQNTKKMNNLFNRDPLLYTSNDINLFYLNKNIDKNYLYNNNDEALNYINKLEENINEKSVLNKIKQIFNHNKKKEEKKLLLNNEENIDDYSLHNKTMNSTSFRNNKKNNKIIMKNSVIDMKQYNKTLQEEINKINSINSDINFTQKKKNNSENKIHNLKKDINKYDKNNNIKNKIKNEGINKINKKLNSNQIENLYNEIIRIKKNLKKYEKYNENGLKYLYYLFNKNKGKKFKKNFEENKIILNLDKKLVFTVNSFND